MAMFAPSFFTGSLIHRFGAERIVAIGLILLIGCAAVALSGLALWQFWTSLILLGLGWNFGFIGATAMVETSDEWIVQRTGIRQRHIAADDETTASLGEAAARAALANAGLTPGDIDLIVLATSTPNNTFPATAVEIQNRLGMTKIGR